MSTVVPCQGLVMKWFRSYVSSLTSLMFLLVCILSGLGGCRDSPFGSGSFLTPPTQSLRATLNSPVADLEPRFSYDGRYLVFTSDRQSQRGIFLYDVPNRRLIDLPGLNQAKAIREQPDISADGRYIVYISEERGKPDVFVYDRVALQSEAITENILRDVRHPTISGNGRFVAFESNRSGQWDIEIYDRGLNVEPSLPTPQPAAVKSPKATTSPTPTNP